jgi:ubiquitin carboxyl-terminal hydrolase 4/11
LRSFYDRRPEWIDPKEFLDPRLQNLFSMSYFSEPGAIIPTGWTGGRDDSKNYPRLDTRGPPVAEAVSPSSTGDSSDNESDKSEVPRADSPGVTRMAEESEEEVDSSPRQVCLPLNTSSRPSDPPLTRC